jgi:signal transduction histidine kinase
MKPTKNPTNGKNGNPKQAKRAEDYTLVITEMEDKLRNQLKKAKEINLGLNTVIEQNNQKINEIISKNNKFISILAHDLRGPFNSIIGFLNLIKENLNNDDMNNVEKYLDIVYNSANNTLNLLDNLLVWTMSQNSEKYFNPITIELDQLIIDEIDYLIVSANQKQITLNQSIEKGLNVTADVQMVSTIIRNLITNAIKFTNPGGEITISAMENEHHIEIAIEDNGIGISFEAQKELFKIDSFHSTIGTSNEKGLGLGLLLCKEFIDVHGGDIKIDSQPGKGCEMKITLPQYIKEPVEL